MLNLPLYLFIYLLGVRDFVLYIFIKQHASDVYARQGSLLISYRQYIGTRQHKEILVHRRDTAGSSTQRMRATQPVGIELKQLTSDLGVVP